MALENWLWGNELMKFKCEWCKKELKDLKGFEAFINDEQMIFCCQNEARDMAWGRLEIKPIKINPEAWEE